MARKEEFEIKGATLVKYHGRGGNVFVLWEINHESGMAVLI